MSKWLELLEMVALIVVICATLYVGGVALTAIHEMRTLMANMR